MSKLKRNTHYIQNEENNMDFINNIVDGIMQEDVNRSPCDFICRKIGSSYPKINHKVLEIPGEFKNIENTDGFTLNGHAIYMDGVESVRFDNGKTIKDYATCIEYLTTDFNPKSEKIFDYDLSIIIRLKKFCYNIIVTNHKQKKKELTYFVDGHPVHVLFRVFDEEKIYEILNTLRKKDYTNRKMCKEDVVKFSYSIAFAKGNYAKDHLEKSVELFCSIEKIDPPQRTDLYVALKEKIKYHFDDDKNKKRELITMITKALTDPDFDELTRREQEEIILKHKDEAIHDRDERIKEQENIISKQNLHLQQKDNIIANNNEIISQKEELISQKDETISQKEELISQKDETISNLRKEIKLLKNHS